MDRWPEDVGVLALEIAFPCRYVDQSQLEVHDGVAQGKYTVGLGQSRMGFCNDREDVNSLCLTVLRDLMDKNGIPPEKIGRLEVGTETIVDKSKSVKTVLMGLFEEAEISDVEGVDSTNACYGGTAALFNAISWIESSAWDGRYAVVVAADIAVYALGPARPTGGAGAVAMLIGPDAPLVFDRGVRSSYMKHAYDFYKPDLSSEYPVVDGRLSIQCYLSALDNCYALYKKKCLAADGSDGGIGSLDAMLFHSPYCKLVQKSLARLVFNDYLSADDQERATRYPGMDRFKDARLEDTYFDRDVEKAFLELSADAFERKTKPSLLLANQVGNMYTSSLYGGLVSLLADASPEWLAGKRIGLFSYGSGLASSMFSITVTRDRSPGSKLEKMIRSLDDVRPRLETRTDVPPDEFTRTMEIRERNCHAAPYDPVGAIDDMYPGTYYLKDVDQKHRRTYARVPPRI